MTHAGGIPVAISGLSWSRSPWIGVYRFARDPILYDFTKLGSRQGLRQGAASWDQHVDAVTHSYQTPTVVLDQQPCAGERWMAAAALNNEKAALGDKSTIDSVQTLEGLLP